MDLNVAARAAEAILFVSGEPVLIRDLAKAMDITELEMSKVLEILDKGLEERGLMVHRYGEHLRLETRPEYAPWIQKMLQPVQKQSLTQTLLETLAVIAYRQPVTKGEVEQVRGVKCDYSVQSLLSKGLIQEIGRREGLGRPILYGTTDQFLEHFGISDIRELPPLPKAELQEKVEEPLTP